MVYKLLVLAAHVHHQYLNIARINAAYSACLTKCAWPEFIKFLSGFS